MITRVTVDFRSGPKQWLEGYFCHPDEEWAVRDAVHLINQNSWTRLAFSRKLGLDEAHARVKTLLSKGENFTVEAVEIRSTKTKKKWKLWASKAPHKKQRLKFAISYAHVTNYRNTCSRTLFCAKFMQALDFSLAWRARNLKCAFNISANLKWKS